MKRTPPGVTRRRMRSRIGAGGPAGIGAWYWMEGLHRLSRRAGRVGGTWLWYTDRTPRPRVGGRRRSHMKDSTILYHPEGDGAGIARPEPVEVAPKIRAFDQKLSGAGVSKEHWGRKPTVTGTGACHVKSFHCKLTGESLEFLDKQINEW